MTPRLILLHGLNNTLESFFELKKRFEAYGFEVCMVPLPGHGDDRAEITNLERAHESFERQLTPFIRDSYVVLAFSTGALYFQHWLQRHPDQPRPRAQVLLAPALFVKNLEVFEKLAFKLPKFLLIPSQTPKQFRRYQVMYFWEYRVLFEAIRRYQESTFPLDVPTLVMMDPKDELVDHEAVRTHLEKMGPKGTVEFKLIQDRKFDSWKRPGKYHVIFHPTYLTAKHWSELTHTVHEFFRRFLSA